jgi:hypothetical protein
MADELPKTATPLSPVESQWGKESSDHFGYASDEERRAKRGLEDWELTEKIPESQRGVPYWFLAVIAAVLLVAVGLSFPFWGLRPGVKANWLDWGFLVALVYIAVAGVFVYYMVNLYGSSDGGRLDGDKPSESKDDADKR